MSWFFGPSKSNLPPITPLQEQRSLQIESLKVLNKNVVELKRDVEYRVTFNIGSGTNNIALHITLPAQFPQEKPHIKISPPVRHPWISNTQTVIGCPSLNSFGVQTDLGRVIQSIIQEMRQNPPFVFKADPVQTNAGTMYQQYNPPMSMAPANQLPLANQHPVFRPNHPGLSNPGGILLQGNQPPSTSLMATQSAHLPGAPSSAAVTQNMEGRSVNHINTLEYLGIEPMVVPTGLASLAPRNKYNMPAIPNSLKDQLSSLSLAQFQEIMDDEETELKVFAELPQVQRLLSERQTLYEACEGLAQTNLSYEPEIEKLKAHLSARLQERTDLRNRFDMSCLTQQSISEQFDPRHILDILKVAAADVEHESESRADAFLEGKTSTEEFLKEYTDLRKTLHLRRAKEEKLDYMLRHGAILK